MRLFVCTSTHTSPVELWILGVIFGSDKKDICEIQFPSLEGVQSPAHFPEKLIAMFGIKHISDVLCKAENFFYLKASDSL